MNQEKERELKPKLRFPEFWDAGEWEEKRLYQIAKPVSDKSTDANDNILTLSGEHGIVLQSEYFGKKIAGENVSRYIRIVRNDFVYNDRTTKASTYGSLKRLSNYENGIVSPIYKCFRFNNGENPAFWDRYFESGFHEAQLHNLINEGARAGRFNISIDRFLSTLVWHPELPEQQKIADCLSSLDDRITLETQKLDSLRDHKKGLMQQLFPTESQTLPQLRFPEFRDMGDWEEKELREISHKIMVGIASAATYAYRKSGIVLFRNQNIKEGYLDDNDILFIDEDYEKSHKNKRLKAGDLLTARTGYPGTTCVVPAKYEGSQSFTTLITRPNNSIINSSYLCIFINSEKGQAFFNSTKIGGGQKNVNAGSLTVMPILYPSHQEQQKIADCLASLDDLIALQAQKIDALKLHKKSLMQQLFPSVDEVSG